MRPRFGPGPKTAIIAGLVIFVATTAVVFGFTSMGLMGIPTFIKGSITTFISAMVSSLVGGWAYREA
jgi:hypothetical protein